MRLQFESIEDKTQGKTRMSKYRYALSAWCALGVMTMATGAFAQGVFSVSSGVEPRAREHGQTELAGGITLTLETAPAPLETAPASEP